MSYKIRRAKRDEGPCSLTVPGHIAEKIPPDMRFECEMTEDGILYRPVTTSVANDKPSWLQK